MSGFDTIHHDSYFDNDGIVDAVQPFEKIEMETAVGRLVPIYEVEDHGRKKLTPVKLHKNGSVKSMSLHDSVVVDTSVGKVSVELITFYESGSVRRVFPLNGKLSGYWTESNEYKLAETLSIPTGVGNIHVKPIYLQFYETGELHSIAFWPWEKVTIPTPIGRITIKKGVSFFKNGALASCEPDTPVSVETPLGTVEAHDPDPDGMNGETNSLSFTEQGRIAGLSTIKTVVTSVDNDAGQSFSPAVERSMCSDTEFTVRPLKIAFNGDVYTFRIGRRRPKEVSSSAVFSLAPFYTGKNLARAKCSL